MATWQSVSCNCTDHVSTYVMYGTNHPQVKHNMRACVCVYTYFCMLCGHSCGCVLYHSITREFLLHNCLILHINQAIACRLFTLLVLHILVASYIYLSAGVITQQNRYLRSLIHHRMHHHLQVSLSKSPKDKMALYKIWHMAFTSCTSFMKNWR